ncbi:putative xylanase/chitin deacetylase [Aciduliprofundum sp. MAR08-339]|nr:putative xylanase/chitin deacetylase [Aciduliprofundum sp. MAR08-339]
MPSLIHTIKTKGFVNTLKRGAVIYSRYSFNRFVSSFNTIIEILEDYNASSTFPITAMTLERNVDTIKEWRNKRIEWAMHGYVHVDYSNLDKETIEKHIVAGRKIFYRSGIELYGFRAPYLSVNDEILGILRERRFLYDSSKSFFVDVIPVDGNVKRILKYYKPIKNWKLENYDGLVEIPVSLPDDEILVDRLGYRGDKIGKIWVKMCEIIKDLGGIPVLQLHPERGRICSDALSMVLEWARKNDINVVQLKDIAQGNLSNILVITGDVDIIKISDLRYMKGEI